jgi:hypothetical protein
MKKGFAVAIVLLSVLLVQLGISGLAAERAEMSTGVYQPADMETAEMSHAVYQPVETEKNEMSHAVYQPVDREKAATIQEADLRMVKPVEMVPEVYRKFESVKKRAGESIALGGGYTLEIIGIDPEDDKVSMELKFDNTVIDIKALEIGSSYVYKGIDIGKIESVSEDSVEMICKCLFFEPEVFFLSVSSLPQGAIIFIDGEEHGSTPKEKIGPMFMEEHTLRLKLEGYEDAESTFQFDLDRVEGGILEMEIDLDEIERDVGGTGTTDTGTTDTGTTDTGTTDTGTTDTGTTDTGTTILVQLILVQLILVQRCRVSWQ